MDIRRGIVRSFNPSTYIATVEIIGSRPAYLEIPAAKYLAERLLAEGEKVAVLFFDETNPNDAIVFAPYGGTPSGWIGPKHIDPSSVWGASNKKLYNVFPASSENDIFRVDAADDSNFVATIASLGTNTVVYNDPTSGNENTIKTTSSAQLGKIVLHNTTRGTSALISSVDTGTNTITLTDNVPGDWQVGDTITARSQTCTGYILTPSPVGYFFDIDVSGTIGSTVAAIFVDFSFYDSSGSSMRSVLHPYEAHSGSKRQALESNAGIWVRRTVLVPIISQRFCFGWTASGSNTASVILRLAGIVEEAAK
ncbi:MAG: hypothetical protein ACUVV0_02910 [Anaerolineae bacterium]